MVTLALDVEQQKLAIGKYRKEDWRTLAFVIYNQKKTVLFCFVLLYNKRNFLKLIGGVIEHTEVEEKKEERGKKEKQNEWLAPGQIASF